MGTFLRDKFRAHKRRGALLPVVERRLEELKAKAPSALTPEVRAAHAFFLRERTCASLTEFLLTSPSGFGITTATPAQRAVCRILDGVPLGDLASHPDVAQLVGGKDALAAIPSEHGELCREAYYLAAIRCAKTIVACAAAIRMALTVGVDRLGPGETARVPIVSLKLETAAVAYNILEGALTASDKLRPLLAGEPTAKALWLVHPSGKLIEIAITHGARAGGGLVAVWLAGAIFDEAPRMNGADDGVVNLTDAQTAIAGRMLKGAQALYIGSPWAPHGPVFDAVEEGWGKPTGARVVLRGTGPMLNPGLWTPEACAQLEEEKPGAYQTDVLGEFADPESGLIDPAAIKRNTRPQAGDLPRAVRSTYSASMDPSDGTAHGNPWTLVVIEKPAGVAGQKPEDAPPMRTAAVREWRGVDPEKVLEEAAAVCRSYGLNQAVTDQYAGSALAALARKIGFTLVVKPWTSPRKVQAFTDLATLIKTNRLELHPDKAFQRDMRSIRKRVTQQGVAIDLPKTGDGRHCDYAPALASAVEDANRAQWNANTFNFKGL